MQTALPRLGMSPTPFKFPETDVCARPLTVPPHSPSVTESTFVEPSARRSPIPPRHRPVIVSCVDSAHAAWTRVASRGGTWAITTKAPQVQVQLAAGNKCIERATRLTGSAIAATPKRLF